MGGFIVSILMSMNAALLHAESQFVSSAADKLRCRVSGVNILLGTHYGTCKGSQGAQYFVSIYGIGISLGVQGSKFDLKSLDGPFASTERIFAKRVGVNAGLGLQRVKGERLKGQSGRVRGWMYGLGLGFTFDNILIKLDRYN